MMTLAQAAAYFDRTPILDPDNGTELFRAQIDPYDDSKRDAGAAYRRILSVAPGTTIPVNRSVRVFGAPWILGAREIDGLAEVHREKYVMQQAPYRASVSRLDGFLASTAALASWCGVDWIKDVKEVEVSSSLPEMCRVFLPAGTDVRVHDVVWYAGSALLVLEVHLQPSGFTVAEALRLEQELPVIAALVRRTYSPAAGEFSPAAPEFLPALRVRWQNLFEYESQGEARYQEGDCALVLPAGTTVTTRDRVQLADRSWSLLAVDQLGGAVVLHARRTDDLGVVVPE